MSAQAQCQGSKPRCSDRRNPQGATTPHEACSRYRSLGFAERWVTAPPYEMAEAVTNSLRAGVSPEAMYLLSKQPPLFSPSSSPMGADRDSRSLRVNGPGGSSLKL